jgi:hypothetical protein
MAWMSRRSSSLHSPPLVSIASFGELRPGRVHVDATISCCAALNSSEIFVRSPNIANPLLKSEPQPKSDLLLPSLSIFRWLSIPTESHFRDYQIYEMTQTQF